MHKYQISNFVPGDIQKIRALRQAYLMLYPGSMLKPPEVLLFPGFENGKNVICVFDENGSLLGYAPLYPRVPESTGLPVTIWALIVVDPALKDTQVQETLWEQMLLRVGNIMSNYPRQKCRIIFEYTPDESGSIDFVLSKGCMYSESHYDMQRELSGEIIAVPLPLGLQIHYSRLETEAEQLAYLATKNRAFPEALMDMAELRFFIKNVLGNNGTTVNACLDQQLIGSISGYWLDEEISKTGVKAGYTEEIFVDSAWRGRGIASSLIGHTLNFLKEHGLEKARLGVRAGNENALGLYRRSGYAVTKESRWYVFEA